jgi:CDGSH-type Zn-finger protein
MPNVEIKSVRNGPNIVLVDGKAFTAVCRCGGSSNKPYRDGTHAKINFVADQAELKVLNQ